MLADSLRALRETAALARTGNYTASMHMLSEAMRAQG